MTIMGKRNDGVSPTFIAVTSAIGTGVGGMLSNGLTTGGVVGTTVGALGAYAATKMIDATVAEATVIGGLSGTIGLIVADKIDAPVSLSERFAFDQLTWTKDL